MVAFFTILHFLICYEAPLALFLLSIQAFGMSTYTQAKRKNIVAIGIFFLFLSLLLGILSNNFLYGPFIRFNYPEWFLPLDFIAVTIIATLSLFIYLLMGRKDTVIDICFYLVSSMYIIFPLAGMILSEINKIHKI